MAALTEEKRREYQRLIADRNGPARSPVVAIPDPFAEYSLTDFEQEMSILAAAGAAWDRRFCQATTGYLGRAGGCWIAYSGHEAKSVIHAEQFVGKSTDQPAVNFWAEYLMRGAQVATAYMLPFVIVARFEDGFFTWKKRDEHAFPPGTIGTRLAKGAAYADCVNMVITLPLAEFKPTSKRK
jgi:hypothetical protein